MSGFTISLGSVQTGLLRLDVVANVDRTDEVLQQILAQAEVKANLAVVKTRDDTVGELLDLLC